MNYSANSCESSENENRDTPQQQIIEMGSTVVKNKRGTIHCLTIIGQVEGHTTLPPNVKTTKYEHVLPLLTSVEEKDDVDGLLLLLNTVGGDIEAGLGIAELVAGMTKPTATLVLGGGHETAFGHGAGVLDAFPGEKVGIINLDAHLDLRFADCASSGTPFRQLALECDAQQRGFHYTCIGVSRAANTQALWDEAALRQVAIVEDLEVLTAFETRVLPELERNIAQFDRLYLTIDLDVLPAREMPAVSAPAALGVPLATLLRIVEPLCRSGKLQAVDLVEFNPLFDIDGQGARAAARVAWQIAHWWR